VGDPVTFPILLHTTIHAASLLGQIATVAALWLTTSMASVLLIVLAARVWSMLLRVKVRMAEFDRTMPIAIFDLRTRRQTRFRLKLTRRQIPNVEGKMIEKLNHAIDYLIDTYDLRKFSALLEDMRPPEFVAAQTLLQCRAEILKDHLPLPSFSYLLKRRLAYLMNTRRTWV
jgi:hypothetical protein